MKLFHLPYSHHSSKIHIALLEKKVAFELIDVSSLSKAQYSNPFNPDGQVPYLEDGEFAMGESAVLMEYLDEVYPVPALVPQHAIDRAQARWLVRFHDTHLAPVLASIFGELNSEQSDPAQLDALGQAMHSALDRIESRLEGAPYWANEKFGMVDATYAMSLWYSHWLAEQLERPLDAERYPKTLDWLNALCQRPSIAVVIEGCLLALGLDTDSQQEAA